MITPNPADYLKYVCAIVRQRLDWTTDEIGGGLCDDDHDIPIEALCDLKAQVFDMAAKFGDPYRYSDGRAVKTIREIENGVTTEHVWHPDPAAEEPQSWRGHLRFDPDEQCPGIFEVSTDPATQEIFVRTVRTA